jgi:regulator of protease activity HflC (stomatin/prohibitin superfamily)
MRAARGTLFSLGIVGGAGYLLYQHPPMVTVGRGETGVRVNRVTGEVSVWHDGGVLVMPGLHEMRVFSMRDQVYRPEASMRADGPSPFQSVEGLSLGVDVAVRYALDPEKLRAVSASLPDDVARNVVEPAVQGVVYKVFARYTVREIFSTKRAEIQQAIESELKGRLSAEGVALRNVQIGKVDLPADYKRGMETLLAEELATEKMRYTLELKARRVKESELEAEAEKQARIRNAEGSAQARRIEATGEAEARQKLADAELYRLEKVGRFNAEQMEREGALVTKHPLLIQKALADKLSDKVQVIIAPPPADGGFIGANLIGKGR